MIVAWAIALTLVGANESTTPAPLAVGQPNTATPVLSPASAHGAASPASPSAPTATSSTVPPSTVTPPTAAELKKSVTESLRKVASADREHRTAAIGQLLTVYGQLNQDQLLTQDERVRLKALVRLRLEKISQELQRQIAHDKTAADKADKSGATKASQPATLNAPQGDAAVLAQVRQAAAGGAKNAQTPAAATDFGPELVEIIQNTIAPSTWDVHGGQGTIMYFGGMRVLVVRQNSEVLDQLGDLLGALRQN